jgi:hypothetical protein
MAYDQQVASAMRQAVAGLAAISELPMFGGLCFMLNGHMLCGVAKAEMMFRVGPQAYEAALAEADAGPMGITGRPMRGLVGVALKTAADDARLAAWVARAVAFVGTLPPK